ncbi:hypothetical protein HHI36_024355 [Cryptolaemus montrouzieri]|uniref:Retrotransposon gag domain-containing protein n=1 Tax=Cryptolaemus montrouzieri TaxID=559131 RepID=A0ABD2PJ91_9CUCU
MKVESFDKLLPTFDGNPNRLEHFIQSIDEFYISFFNTNEILKKYVFARIKSKLLGEAHNLLYCRSDITTWENLKIALRHKFGDPISYLVLLHELNYFNKLKNESLMDFINRLKQFMQRIFAKIQAEEANPSVREAFNLQTKKTAIITLINSQISLRIQLNASRQIPNRNPSNRNKNQNTNNTQIYKMQIPQNSNCFPSQPINIQPRQIQLRFPSNIPAFKQSKQNVFAPQRNQNFPKPVPMCKTNAPLSDNKIGSTGTVSMRTYRPNKPQSREYNHFSNIQPTQKYTVQELTNLECENPSYNEEENEEYDYSSDPNFLTFSEYENPNSDEQTSETFTNQASYPDWT